MQVSGHSAFFASWNVSMKGLSQLCWFKEHMQVCKSQIPKEVTLSDFESDPCHQRCEKP